MLMNWIGADFLFIGRRKDHGHPPGRKADSFEKGVPSQHSCSETRSKRSKQSRFAGLQPSLPKVPGP